MKTILIGTTNFGKAHEVRMHLGDLPITWKTLADVAPTFEVDETAQTFEGNAQKKALEMAKFAGMATIAGDSGLEIPALGGWPGLKSRRVKSDGSAATDREIIAIAREKISMIPEGERQFRFVSVFSFATPEGQVATARGELVGELTLKTHAEIPVGLPYRAFWWMPTFNKYFIDLSPEEQAVINHNKYALDQLRPAINAYLANRSTVREEQYA